MLKLGSANAITVLTLKSANAITVLTLRSANAITVLTLTVSTHLCNVFSFTLCREYLPTVRCVCVCVRACVRVCVCRDLKELTFQLRLLVAVYTEQGTASDKL